MGKGKIISSDKEVCSSLKMGRLQERVMKGCKRERSRSEITDDKDGNR